MNTVHAPVIRILALIVLAATASCSGPSDNKSRQAGAQPAQQTAAKPQASQVKQIGSSAKVSGATPDSVYRESCGACHPPYAPDLLPSASWDRILSRPSDHFGEAFELDPQGKNAIFGYLKANSAERSSSQKSSRIMSSLGGRTPARITEIPYIRDKHGKISPDVFKRASIGSFSRCSACHPGVDKGAAFSKRSVAIPR